MKRKLIEVIKDDGVGVFVDICGEIVEVLAGLTAVTQTIMKGMCADGMEEKIAVKMIRHAADLGMEMCLRERAAEGGGPCGESGGAEDG